MFTKASIALAVAVFLGAAATAATAATTSGKVHRHHGVRAAAPPAPAAFDPDSPAATGGGSLGYNQSIKRDDW